MTSIIAEVKLDSGKSYIYLYVVAKKCILLVPDIEDVDYLGYFILISLSQNKDNMFNKDNQATLANAYE